MEMTFPKYLVVRARPSGLGVPVDIKSVSESIPPQDPGTAVYRRVRVLMPGE